LEIKNIHKIFPGTIALSEADFDLYAGEVHALVGENGAGKSTMIKIVTGVHQPDIGEIIVNGKTVKFKNAMDSYDSGIAAIYQEASLFNELTVTENIFMGHHKVRKGFKMIRWEQMYKETENLIKSIGVDISPYALVKSLSIAQKQIVEIMKALSMDSNILIMDEPTSALTIEETNELFDIVKKLKEKGTGIIYISHRLEEIFEIADRATVLRDGKIIGTLDREEITEDKLITMMVGRSIDNMYPKEEAKIGENILKVENIYRAGEFKDISFEVKKGEIVGLAGLVGSGRTEIAKAIFGLEKLEGGKIFFNGEEVNIKNPLDAIKLGIAYLSESRGEYGLVLKMDIAKNITLPNLRNYQKFSFIEKDKEYRVAKKYFDLMDIKASSLNQIVNSLSGGNQQKVAIAKWLATNAKILILDEPTRGVDVGTKAAVHKLMSDLAKEGIAILMISSELPEIIGMSDRIIVLHEGVIKTILSKEECKQENILAAAIGSK